MSNTVLILGARGRFGLAAAQAFVAAGWRVLGQIRPGATPPAESRIQWLCADPHDSAALANAARGAAVVVHALNPAYTNRAWREQVLPMTQAAIEVARLLDATLMVPGNVYNFGSHMPTVLREDSAQQAQTVKGRIRIEMENQLQRSGVRSVVIRAGDFFGGGRGTWFDTVLVKNLQKGVFTYPGPTEVAKAWAYLPDLAQSFVAVAQRRDQLRPFELLHFAGHQINAAQWVAVLAPWARSQGWVKAGGTIKLSSLPWPLIRLGALLMPTWDALLEMRYLWGTPHALANERLCALIGPEPHTPLARAAQAALLELGLLAPGAAAPLGLNATA